MPPFPSNPAGDASGLGGSDGRTPLDQLSSGDLLRIVDALRYTGRDLHTRSYAVSAERRELLWQEMDACLELAERLQAGLQRPRPVPIGSDGGCTLITGASSGIGAALARRFAREGRPLVLTARRRERLEALAAELQIDHQIAVHTIALDLAVPSGAYRLLQQLAERNLAVHTLVNNAGFGLRGDFTASAWPRAQAMLQLMVHAPAELSHGLLPAMQAYGSGRILNVSSLAGLVPGLPGSTLYSASKAFLIRFSQSLAAEQVDGGVRVVALCPGYVRSEFHAVLGVQERMQRLPGLFWMEAEQLVQQTVQALNGSQVVIVPGLVNRLIAGLARLLPDPAAGRLSAAFSRRYRKLP